MIYLDPALVAGEVDDEIPGLVEIVRPVARGPLLAGHFARLFACLTASHSDCLAREENLICSLVYILRQHGMGRPTSSGPSAQLLGPPSEPRSIKGPKPYQMKACWGPLAPSLNFTATALLSNGLWNSGLRRPRLHLLTGQRHVFARHDFFHPVSPKMIRRTSLQAGRLHLIDEGSVSVGFKIRTADGTLINHIEGCKTGTKEVVSQSFERDRAGSSCVLARSPGDRQGRVFREFTRRLAWNGSERNSSSGSQQIALAGGWLCSLESYRRSGALSVDAGAAAKLSPLVSGSPTIRSTPTGGHRATGITSSWRESARGVRTSRHPGAAAAGRGRGGRFGRSPPG